MPPLYTYYSRQNRDSVRKEIQRELIHALEKPWQILALSMAFMITPVLSYLTSLSFLAPEQWYQPSSWGIWASRLSLHTWIWSVGIFLSGALLLFQHKWTWGLSVALTLGSVVYQLALIADAPHYPTFFKLMSLCFVAGGAAVLYFFRYPYLDRREKWWGIDKRYTVKIPAIIQGVSRQAQIENISKSGALISLANVSDPIHMGQKIVIVLSESILIATVIRMSGSTIGVHFEKSSQKTLREILRTIAD